MASAIHEEDVPVTARQVMLQKVAESDGFFKSQQRGDADLTYEEKYNIAEKLLSEKPSTFLSRFGKYLSEDDLLYFDSMRNDYMVAFYLKELKQMGDDKKNKTKVRNRRYEAMKELMDKGSYFSDEEMKLRDPLLYEQMVGRYLSDDEIQDMVDRSDLRFSSILTKHMDVQESNIIYNLQKEIEESQMEEEDEESEEEENMEEGEDGEKVPEISAKEKSMLKAEFLRTMQLKFLDGEPDYDYSNIDGNVAYDSLDIRERDEQEKYFDEEDNETRGSSKSSSTGDLTFLTPSQFRKMKTLSDKLSPLALDDNAKNLSHDNDCRDAYNEVDMSSHIDNISNAVGTSKDNGINAEYETRSTSNIAIEGVPLSNTNIADNSDLTSSTETKESFLGNTR